jgi:hypothetical protein
VVKSFEHLSDAQLEHYGTDSTTSISDDAQRIEAHLEDCADCRSRVLEHQRARFGLATDAAVQAIGQSGCASEDDLPNVAAGIAPGDRALIHIRHAAQCTRCGTILRQFTEDFSEDITPDERDT